MKTLAYHEGIPGHHFQVGIQTELNRTAEPGLPIFRPFIPFTAYVEGWALYSEQLAYELGFYKNNPFSNLGRLQAEMWRSVRLVVDTGIHYKRWTREKAKRALGPKFDLKQFHRVVLANGAVPLSILEENVNAYIQEKSE